MENFTLTNSLINFFQKLTKQQTRERATAPITQNTMKKIKIGQIVKFNGVDFKLISCNMGGKCKIEKLLLPNKGRILKDVDINNLS